MRPPCLIASERRELLMGVIGVGFGVFAARVSPARLASEFLSGFSVIDLQLAEGIAAGRRDTAAADK